MLNIATDGACKGNPGPGGWGVAVFEDDEFLDGMYAGELQTTNNRMELMAFINGCSAIQEYRKGDEPVTLYIDSQYVIRGCQEWLRGWRQKDYKGVKNDDLWRQIADLRQIWLPCSFVWVKGHNGQVYNEMADTLANKGVECILNDDGWF